jgi:GNAT superfamily N-acetyltransferase
VNAALPTRPLAALIEASETVLLHAFLEAASALAPERLFDCAEICGGLAAFMGVNSPLSQTTGVAFSSALDDGAIDRVTRFYHEHGATARVWANPLADQSLEPALARYGYLPRARNNVLALDVTAARAQRDPRVIVETDPRAWGHASWQGFRERHDGEAEGTLLATSIAAGEGVVALAMREGERIVATAAMAVHGQLASLFAGSTLDDRRGNGYHAALVEDRVARAREAGARYARTSAPIGSTSEANFRRCGFHVLYTRTLWELPPPA